MFQVLCKQAVACVSGKIGRDTPRSRCLPLMIIMTTLSEPKSENTQPAQPAPFIHIFSAGAAVLILIMAVFFTDRYASSLEDAKVDVLAHMNQPQVYTGSVVQQAAFRQEDLLPVYGSSEMLADGSPYHASAFFSAYPTGFTVLNISKGGNTSLNMAQALAAIGPEMRGKKVVISFTPAIFWALEITEYAYSGNFSHMHAAALVFSPDLSLDVKQRAARRMLDYPGSLTRADDALLTFALKRLAGGTFPDRVMYALSVPLGRLDTLIIRMQDHYAVWKILQKKRVQSQVVLNQPRDIDWEGEIASARARQEAIADNNPYGIENKSWIVDYNQALDVKQPGSGDKKFTKRINRSLEWTDMAIVLDILHQLGAEPLLLSRPINGPQMAAVSGMSEASQQVFYTRLQDLAQAYSLPLVDYQQYTNDRFFSVDRASHPSQYGWVVVDQTLDSFYHNALP
jgi:D-alanine transfer protein